MLCILCDQILKLPAPPPPVINKLHTWCYTLHVSCLPFSMSNAHVVAEIYYRNGNTIFMLFKNPFMHTVNKNIDLKQLGLNFEVFLFWSS